MSAPLNALDDVLAQNSRLRDAHKEISAERALDRAENQELREALKAAGSQLALIGTLGDAVNNAVLDSIDAALAKPNR